MGEVIKNTPESGRSLQPSFNYVKQKIDIKQRVADAIEQIQRDTNLNDRQIAEHLRVSTSHINLLLRQQRKPSSLFMQCFNHVFGLNPEYFTAKTDQLYLRDRGTVSKMQRALAAIMQRYNLEFKDLAERSSMSHQYVMMLLNGTKSGSRAACEVLQKQFGLNPAYIEGTSDEIFVETNIGIKLMHEMAEIVGGADNETLELLSGLLKLVKLKQPPK